MSWPWSELGLSGPASLTEIRNAYAQRLKTTHPEDDPEGFQRLHTAYQEASRYARRAGRQPAPGARAEPAPEPEREAGSSGEERLEDQGPPKPPPEKTEADWDYGELLEEEAKAPEEPPEKTAQGSDWDYERLFAEGEAEAQAARRRKLEELREKNRARYAKQEQEQRRRAADEEESWQAVTAAAHALELLYGSGAPLAQWRRFLSDPVFLNVRANLDFVFALEDFLEQHPDLSPDIRKAIFLAYEAQNASKYPEYGRLYRLLGVGRKDRRQSARAKSGWRRAWRSYPTWRKAVIVACFAILAVFFAAGWAVNLRTACRDFTQRRESQKWETQSLAWLEEDFGEPFTQPLGGEKYQNIYAPVSDPTLYFWVLQDGEREGRWPGYRTDYPHVRVMRAMQDFAGEWELGLELSGAGGGFSGDIGSAPGAYLFDLPLEGAGDAITALGRRIAELETQEWYRVLEDRYDGRIIYQVLLCHKGLSFYDATIGAGGGGFDADYARARYETQVPGSFCRYVLEATGLAARHLGEDAYVLLDQGTAELNGQSFFLVSGLDKDGYEPRVQYLMASGGAMIFCLPADRLEEVRSLIDLYRGAISHAEVKDVGLVMIYDQVPAE